MDEGNIQLAAAVIGDAYATQAATALRQRKARIRHLITQRTLPKDGFDDLSIRELLIELAQMDSNNHMQNAGVGEREGRVFSALVQERHFGMAHGIGRSGEIAAIQPKAAGSSLMMMLTRDLCLRMIKISGILAAKSCIVLPMATGMGIVMALIALRKQRQRSKYVLWPRIDQKTCLKSITTAGFIPVVVENLLVGDCLRTDNESISRKLQEIGCDNVLCVLSTTSCFAPRTPDDVIRIAKCCQERNIPHVINNAYGLQSSKICGWIEAACRQGRVDFVVQSTDKNFMVPVGGSIVFSPSKPLIKQLSQEYPGRASSSPIVDMFITMLSMGEMGYKQLLARRKENLQYFRNSLEKCAAKYGERVLDTDRNDISFALTLDSFEPNHTFIGSMLFSRRCSGNRVVDKRTKKVVAGIEFSGYGAHCSDFPHHYMAVACAIGSTTVDYDLFVERLDGVLQSARKRDAKQMTAKREEKSAIFDEQT